MLHWEFFYFWRVSWYSEDTLYFVYDSSWKYCPPSRWRTPSSRMRRRRKVAPSWRRTSPPWVMRRWETPHASWGNANFIWSLICSVRRTLWRYDKYRYLRSHQRARSCPSSTVWDYFLGGARDKNHTQKTTCLVDFGSYPGSRYCLRSMGTFRFWEKK